MSSSLPYYSSWVGRKKAYVPQTLLHAGIALQSGVNAHMILMPPDSPPAALRRMASHQQQLCWQRRDVTKAVVPTGYALMFTAHVAPLHQQVTFHTTVTQRPVLSFLWDHQVGKKPIFPAAGFLEMATAAACCMSNLNGVDGGQLPILTAVKITAPCQLPEITKGASHPSGTLAQLLLVCELDLVTGRLAVKSRGRGKETPIALHMHAEVGCVAMNEAVDSKPEGAGGLPGSVSFDAARASCTGPLDVAAVYHSLCRVGLSYGPSFRRLSSVVVGNPSSGGAISAVGRG